MLTPSRPPYILIAWTLGVMLVVLLTLNPVLSCTALSFDDDEYITDNRLVKNPSLDSVRRFFAEVLEPSTVPGYYQPVAMTSLMLDVAAGARHDYLQPFHQTGLMLHLLCTGLVVLLAYQLFGHALAAAAVGLLFGLHPAATEVIPWVAQRKTLLATFFSLLCLVSYVHYARRGGWNWYATSIVMFILALLSKPTAVPIVAVLFILDWWPLNRLHLPRANAPHTDGDPATPQRRRWPISARNLLEKSPFIVIAIVFAIITYISQTRTAGTFVAVQHSWWHGLLILGYTLSFYPRQLLWPTDWPGYYGFPANFTLTNPSVALYVLASIALLVLLALSLRRTRALAAAWLAFFILLFPTLGIIGFTEVLAANRFLYLPMIALGWPIAAWLARRATMSPEINTPSAGLRPDTSRLQTSDQPTAPPRRNARKKERRNQTNRSFRIWAAAPVIVVLAFAEGYASRSALDHWRNTMSLYRHLSASAPDAPKVRYNLANALRDAGLSDDAIQEYNAAIELNPRYAEAHNNLAEVLVNQGHVTQALSLFQRAMELAPQNHRARNNFGAALVKLGHHEHAIDAFREAIRLRPDYADAYFNLGIVLMELNRWPESASALEQAKKWNPKDADTWARLGFVYEQLNRTDEATEHYRKAITMDPTQHVAAERLRLLRNPP